jgi:myxalamid-type polyketide synthase MxaE and MxaD
VQKIVASVDWERFLPIYEARRARPLIEHMRSDEQSQPAPKEDSAAEQILAAPLAQRFDLLKAHVRDQVAQVLGFGEPGKIDPQQGFFSLGMDSVMAVQLRIRFEKSMGQPLPSTIAFEYPTIDTFTAYLADEVLKLNAVSTAVPSAEGSSPAETPGAAQKALSEDELLSKLDEELAAFNRLAEGD